MIKGRFVGVLGASGKGRRKCVDGTSSASQGLRFINSRTHYFYDGEEIIRSSLPIATKIVFHLLLIYCTRRAKEVNT